MQLKPNKPWKTAGKNVDLTVDPLDSLDMDDGGLFVLTLKQKKIPFVGKF